MQCIALAVSASPGCAVPSAAGVLIPEELAMVSMDSGRPGPRALLVGVDGLQSDAVAAAHTPHLDRLMRRGRGTLKGRSGPHPKSGPGWSTILTGRWPAAHGVTGNRFCGHRLAQHPDLFHRLRARRPEIRTGLVYSWPQLHRFGTVADYRVDVSTQIDPDAAAEAVGCALLARDAVDFLFVYFGGPDEAGHRDGFSADVPAYRRAIERMDRQLGRLLSCRLAPGPWLVAVTTDHGGGGGSLRQHGVDHPADREVLIVFEGAGVPAGPASDGTLAHVDVASVLARHLLSGDRPPLHPDGTRSEGAP